MSNAQEPVMKAEAAGGKKLSADEQKALDLQNQARQEVSKKHGTPRPNLIWDETLEAGAREWASHLAATNKFEHSGANGVGENLAGGTTTLAAGVELWLGEEKNYHGQPIDKDFAKYGHYTQIIWPGTTKVGIALVKDKDSSITVARYSPPGNYMGVSAWTGK